MKTAKKPKVVVSMTMDQETKARLLAFAEEKHTTMSQAITDWLWSIKLPSEIRAEEAAKKLIQQYNN